MVIVYNNFKFIFLNEWVAAILLLYYISVSSPDQYRVFNQGGNLSRRYDR